MKIAFAGASGTGKTTLARWVSDTYGLPLNPVGSRSVAKEMGFVGPDGEGRPYDVDKANRTVYEMTRRTASVEEAARASLYEPPHADANYMASASMRPVFQRKLAEAKIAWESEHDAFVTDRTSLDDCAYAILHCREVVDAEFLNRAYKHTGAYTLVVYCPAAVFCAPSGDPARVNDAVYQSIYDALILGLLRTSKRDVAVLDEETITQREIALTRILRMYR